MDVPEIVEALVQRDSVLFAREFVKLIGKCKFGIRLRPFTFTL